MLVYDWTNEGDVSSIIEDIETLNFDYEKEAKKMSDWRFENVQDLRTKRLHYEERHFLHMDYTRYDFDVPELHYSAEEDEERMNMFELVRLYTSYNFVHNEL